MRTEDLEVGSRNDWKWEVARPPRLSGSRWRAGNAEVGKQIATIFTFNQSLTFKGVK